jgi:outer membrane protein TolC
LDTARHKLRVGTLTFFDVQQRNQELQEARSRLLRNQLDFRIAEAVLQHSQGRLFRDPQK